MTPLLWCIALLFVFFLGLIIGGWIEHKIMVRGLNRVVNPDPTRFVSQHVPTAANEGDRWYNLATGRDYIFQKGEWIGCTIADACDHQWVQRWHGSVEMERRHCGVRP